MRRVQADIYFDVMNQENEGGARAKVAEAFLSLCVPFRGEQEPIQSQTFKTVDFPISDTRTMLLHIPLHVRQLNVTWWNRQCMLAIRTVDFSQVEREKTPDQLLEELKSLVRAQLNELGYYGPIENPFRSQVLVICSPELRGAIEKPLKDFCKQRCVEKDMDESVMGVDYLPVPSETNFVYFKHKLLTHLQSTLGDLCAQKNIITYALNKEDSPSRQYVSKRTSEALVLKMQEVIHLARVNQSVIDALINDFDALFLHGEGLESFFAESVFSTFIRFYVVHLSQLLRENKVQAAKESCLQLLKKFNDYTQKYGPEFKTAVAALLLHMGEAYRDKKGLECFGHMLLEQSQNIQPDGSLKKRILISLNALVNPTETGLKKLCELPELQRQPRFQAVQEAIHRAKRTFFQSATGVSLLFTTPHEKASPPQACAASPAPRAGNA